MSLGLEGRSSVAFPARFIDTHVHLWDRRLGLDYSWLDGDASGPLGRLPEVSSTLWDAGRFADEVRFHRPDRVVHVQATNPSTASIAETAWLDSERATTGFPSVFVVRADLRSPDLARRLAEQIAEHPGVVGVRDMSLGRSLTGDDLLTGLQELERLQLVWEVSCAPEEFADLATLARLVPALRIVLGHGGWPWARTAESFDDWQKRLGELVSVTNVVCKVSGLGMADHAWSVESWRPWVETAVRMFGPSRSMFGSNWPIDRVYASYESELLAMNEILSDLTDDERDAFWYVTAADVFSL